MSSEEAAPPQSYSTAGVLMMVSGGLNVFWFLLWAVGSCTSIFSGVLCGPCLAIVPTAMLAVAGAELYVGNQIRQGQPAPNAQVVSIVAAVCSLLCFCGVLMASLEFAAYAMLQHPDVKRWLAGAAAEVDEGLVPG